MLKINKEQINGFWEAHKRFLNASLTTETPNSDTTNLSQLCQSNLNNAFDLFKKVELSAIKALLTYSSEINSLQQAVQNCIKSSNKIYIIGCGASARLAVLLRRLWDNYFPDAIGTIVSVSSAGDTSLIRSVEQFEDSAEFGIKQLQQQGFSKNDLLIGLSASGESPFILAAIEYASSFSSTTPWLICNNSAEDILARNPHNVIINNKVKTLTLNVGEMALTGSTRLQATTTMQIAVGFALCLGSTNIESYINMLVSELSAIDLTQLAKITRSESDIILNHEYILYQTNNNLLGLSMLADITERSPTFNITQFENYANNTAPKEHSPFYLSLIHAKSVNEAWLNLLGQAPFCLNWDDFPQTPTNYMNGFDLSNNSPRVHTKYLPKAQHNESWLIDKNKLSINLLNHNCEFILPQDNLSTTLVYKLLLNSHSTLMYGVLGYYQGNLMLSLTPSNFKLIDRAIRYSIFLLKNKHSIDMPYIDVANILFDEMKKLQPNQSIVINVINQALNIHK